MMGGHPRDQETRANFALVITSDIRTKGTDETGRTATLILEEAGHRVPVHRIVPNNEAQIRAQVAGLLKDDEINVIITSGGTGMSPRDRTVEAVSSLLEKELAGFGEHFRRLSYDEIGVAGIMSRALAGTVKDKLVFCLPGSRGAMETALVKIILPGIGHWLWELGRA